MRCRLFVGLLGAIVLTIIAPIRAAGSPETVVYVKLTGNANDVPADVFEQPVGGTAILLINHKKLPATFRGRIEEAQPAGNGAVLLIKESEGVIISNRATGAQRVVLGSSYSMNSQQEKVVKQFPTGFWLWRRDTGSLRKIPLASKNEYISDPAVWSPDGRLLLAQVQQQGGSRVAVRLYDPANGKMRNLRIARGLSFAVWAPNAKAVLTVETADDVHYQMFLTPLAGKARLLFTRTSRITAAALSPDGSLVGFGDTGGFFLFRISTGRITKLAIALGEGLPSAGLAFSPDGGRLGLLATVSGSGPYANVHEELWTADANTDAVTRLAQWDVTLGNAPGEDACHQFLGWPPDAASLLVLANSCTLEGPQTEWRQLWSVPLGAKQSPTLLFDSGPYVIDLQPFTSASSVHRP